ncbi:16S rRNA methyltransferase [Paenibacillus swuensis]|uniref:Ribosomal RNA small subunit methyltransferase I n=1 Tax=Paenibacillus swuensis TaxID=1178515 RepID=A0A172TGJ9_9BACL|nr:16S rRNA (cytidine(1402)-2'-O)-methyltransferase [Paenibacillus swuensis]ANE46007.1 16S rRNA methyltransferase [Paenibacillus swuensis]
MKLQKSFHNQLTGTLYLVATPIGNLEDMTFRAIRTLKEVDLIAAEDTRQTRKLMNHYEISTRLISYHEHNKHGSGPEIIRMLLEGQSVAIVSDAGLPAISDPGYDLVVLAVEQQIAVVPVPGANAALSALIISGLPTESFHFVGFLPRERKTIHEQLDQVKTLKGSLLFYESPHRVHKTLTFMQDKLGDRRIALVRELTKRYEEAMRGTISECIAYLEEHPAQGEYCIVVEGSQGSGALQEEGKWWTELTEEEHVTYYEGQSHSRKDAIKLAALDRKIPKRELYNSLLTK